MDMSNEQLIDALKRCASANGEECRGCPALLAGCEEMCRQAAKRLAELDTENERLIRWTQELEENCSFESTGIIDGDRVRSITDGELLELLRARDEGRLVVLPREDGENG